MRVRLIAVLVFAAASAQAAHAVTVSAAAIRQCGQMSSHLAFKIESRKIPCRQARHVVRRWGQTAAMKRGGDGWVLGLYCNYRDVGYETGAIRCAHRGRVVRWRTSS
jgi:hypothetical protein